MHCVSFAVQYVVETKYVGEHEIPGAATEVVGRETHVVSTRSLCSVVVPSLLQLENGNGRGKCGE